MGCLRVLRRPERPYESTVRASTDVAHSAFDESAALRDTAGRRFAAGENRPPGGRHDPTLHDGRGPSAADGRHPGRGRAGHLRRRAAGVLLLGLQRLVPCDCACFSELDVPTRIHVNEQETPYDDWGDVGGDATLEGYWRWRHQHLQCVEVARVHTSPQVTS
ncbi:hypothetical protein ACRAWF_22925 [Streptomyces sp. L7]